MSLAQPDFRTSMPTRRISLGRGVVAVAAMFFSLEFLLLCVLFGFPIDSVPVIGAYSFWTNIIFGLAATAATLLVYRQLGWKLRRITGTILLLHLVFTSYVVLNLIQTNDVFHFGLRKSALVLIGGCWTILAASAVAARPDGAERFAKALLVYGLLFTMLNLILPIVTGGLLRTALTDNYQHASRAAGLGVLACLAYLTHKDLTGKAKLGMLVLLLLGLVAQLASGGRTGLGASFICIFAFLVLNFRLGGGGIRIKKRFFIFAGLALVGLGVLVYLIANGWRPATVNRFLVILEGSSELNVSFSNRVGRYQKFDDLFSQAPILGHGTGSWDEISGEVESYYPHNLIMELLVEQGMIGAALLLGPLIALVIRFLKYARVRENFAMQAILLYAVYVVTTTMFTGDLGLNLYLYSVLALLASARNPAKAAWTGERLRQGP